MIRGVDVRDVHDPSHPQSDFAIQVGQSLVRSLLTHFSFVVQHSLTTIVPLTHECMLVLAQHTPAKFHSFPVQTLPAGQVMLSG